MPLHRRLPKRGFTNIHAPRFSEIGLATLQEAVDAKRIDASKPVTEAVLKESGLITHLRDGVRLLGNGEISAKLTIEIAGATASAVKAVEAAGGRVTQTWVKPDTTTGKYGGGKGKGKAKAEAAPQAPAAEPAAEAREGDAGADDGEDAGKDE